MKINPLKSPNYCRCTRENMVVAFSIALLFAGSIQKTMAATPSWKIAVSGTWTDTTAWSNGVAPVAGDTVTFNAAGQNGDETIYLNGNQAAASLVFNNTGTTTLLGGVAATPAANTLTLSAGIIINSGAGAVTIGDTSVSPAAQVSGTLTASQNFTNNSGSLLTIANTLNSGAAATLTINGTGAVALSGANTLAGLTVMNNASGTLTLSGSNNGAGGVTLTAGTLNINNTNALGAVSGTLTISSGTINNTSGAAITNAVTTSINIGGDFGFGTALSGTNNNLNLGVGAVSLALPGSNGTRTVTLNGTSTVLTMGGAATTGNVASFTTLAVNGVGNTFVLGSLRLNDNVTARVNNFNGTGNITINGAVTSGTGNAAQQLTYAGSGTMTLAGNNSYGGITTLNNAAGTLTLGGSNSGTGVTLTAGMLNINNAYALGAAAGTLTLTSGTINNTSGAAVTNANANPIILGDFGFGTALSGSNNNLSLGSGTIALGLSGAGGTRTITLNGTGTTLTMGGLLIIGNYGNNADTVAVNGTGNTLVLGSLRLNDNPGSRSTPFTGSGNVTVAGAVISGTAFASQPISYIGTGTMTLAGNNTYGGLTTMNNSAGTLTLSGSNSGAGGVTLTAGTLNINNAYALGAAGGTLTITSGTINNTSGTAVTSAIARTVTVGGDFGFGTATSGSNNNLNLGTGAASLAITISGTRTITLNGTDSTLTLGGAVTGQTNIAGNGTLTVNGAGNTLVFGSLVTNTNTTARTFNINGTGNLTINGIVSGGATAELLTYGGSGVLTFKGANTYTGATTINSGIVNYQNGTAFGTNSAITITTGSSATIQVQGGITGGNQLLTISGTGASGQNGALVNVSGTNSYGGAIALGAAATISSDAGLLNLTGATISGNTFGLSLTGAGNGSISNVIGTTTGSLTKNGTGTWTLSGANTFTGQVTINAGTLSVATLAANGTAQPLGENSTVNLGGSSTSGTLQYTGVASGTLSQNIAIGLGNGTISNTGGNTLTLAGTLNKANAVLTLAGGVFNVTGQITGGNSSTFNSDLDISNATVTVSNTNNNYTGPTVVYNGGTLLNGTDNALPTGTVLTTGSSSDGAVTNTYNLNGFNQTIAALNSVSAGGNNNIVTTSGTTGTKTLTLTGVESGTNGGGNTVANGSFGGHIQDSGSGAAIALVVSGGVQTLTGSNGYSGGTTITGGNLVVANSAGTATGTNTVTVTSALSQIATLSGNGIIGGQVITSATSGSVGVAHLAPGINISGANGNFGNAGVLQLSNGLTIGNGTNLDFDLGLTSDLISVNGNLSLGSNVVFNYQTLSGSLATNTAYDLINFTGSLTGGFTGWTAVGTAPAGTTSTTFAVSGTTITVTFNASAATPGIAYWQGSVSASGTGVWNTVTSGSTNFTTDAAGTANTGAIPGSVTNVIFTANSASNLNTTLGQDITINSLEFTGTSTTAATNPVTIGGTNTLTVSASGTNGNTAGVGIMVDAGSAAHTISSNVALGASQTWIVNGNPLTVSGNVSDGGNTYGLTKSGTGTLILSGSESYTGATAVGAGTLQVDGSLNAASAVTVGVAKLSGTGNIGGGVALTGTSNISSVGTLTVASLDVNGAGNQISSGTVNATGGTTVHANSGLAVNGTLGGGAVGVSGVLSGTGKVTSAVTVSAGGSTSPGMGSAPGKLTLDLAYNAGSTANFNIASANPDNGSPQGNLSNLYYAQVAVSGSANVVNLGIGTSATLGADSATSQSETSAQISSGTSNSGVTLKLTLTDADYNTLISHGTTSYMATSSNSTLDNYFVFTLGAGLSTGRFTTLDINVNGVDTIGTIYYSGINDRFAADGVGNTIGDVWVGGQEYALSYTGDFGSNSTIGGNDIVLTAIPEPDTWGMILGGFGMLVCIQRLRRRRVGI